MSVVRTSDPRLTTLTVAVSSLPVRSPVSLTFHRKTGHCSITPRYLQINAVFHNTKLTCWKYAFKRAGKS